MGKKNAGALFMDFRVSPDDRVGAQTQRGRVRAVKPGKKAPRGSRVEPELGVFDDIHVEDERAPRGRTPRQRAKGKSRGRRERPPLTAGAASRPHGLRARPGRTCANVHWRGGLSGRQRWKVVPWRKRSPLQWS